MNRAALLGALCGAGFGLAGCGLGDEVKLDLGDVDAYQAFLETQAKQTPSLPFEAEPLSVSAVGKIRAEPDLAVITARITATDKNESRAVNDVSETLNQIQAAITDMEVETGFTTIRSNREFDEVCQNNNLAASARQREIQQDYWFNKRLNDRGDTKTKRRDPKRRIAEQVGAAQEIKVTTDMVIRIKPAARAGDVLNILAQNNVERSNLFGYDFSDFDSLYQQAADKAVGLARRKAELIAKGAGGELGEIVSFTVSSPNRIGRFGPQPTIIRPSRPPSNVNGSVLDRNRSGKFTVYNGASQQTVNSPGTTISHTGDILARVLVPPPQTSYGTTSPAYEDELIVVQEASTELITAPPVYQTVYDNGIPRRVQKQPASTQERVIPAIVKKRSELIYGTGTTNVLSISLLSGPQTISVTASLAYQYDTPLTGKIILKSEKK